MLNCRVIECDQDTNTEQWDKLRSGRITASRIADVVAKPDTKRYKQYKREITFELLGHSNQEKSPEWYRHGREMEPRGLARSEYKYGWELDRNVFLIHPEYDWLGCSPDSLIVTQGQYSGGVEMKARKLYKNYREAIQRYKDHADGDRTKMVEPLYAWQIQTAMWITGLDHWWYLNYYEVRNEHGHPTGEYKLGRAPIPRDEVMIERIEEACLNFMHECYDNAALGG
jgi:hypothetical protein